MLFSEPKIPQSETERLLIALVSRFSALQRAENSSILAATRRSAPPLRIQCSSASRKFLNLVPTTIDELAEQRDSVLFSEPKIPQSVSRLVNTCGSSRIQCSSASRKFLNPGNGAAGAHTIKRDSVLFSEPKIPQSIEDEHDRRAAGWDSVLFSEPKIPQSAPRRVRSQRAVEIQCSSASRKFLNLAR